MMNARCMMKARWTRHMKRAACGGVLGLTVLAVFVPGSARAQDDDPKSIWNLDKRIFDGFAKGLGLKKGDTPGIDYRERSPLVVPPSRDLPAPENTAASRNPAWPVDPDIKRRQDLAAKKNLDRRGFDEERDSRSLAPSELNPPGTAGAPRGRTASKPAGNEDNLDGSAVPPSQLGYFGGMFTGSGFGFGGRKEEVGTFTKEPPRQSLTVPPVGYQTPSAEQPYGVSKERVRQKVTPLDPAVGSLGQ